jgi:hypothetical protein
MGITGLAKLIADIAPHVIKENEIKNYFGRKIAVDASKFSKIFSKFMSFMSFKFMSFTVSLQHKINNN